MKNKKKELIILQPVQTQNFSKLLLDTYYMPSHLLSIGDTKVKGTWLLPLRLMVSKGVQEANNRVHGEGNGQITMDQKWQRGIPRKWLHHLGKK